jgi:hypothetical protein
MGRFPREAGRKGQRVANEAKSPAQVHMKSDESLAPPLAITIVYTTLVFLSVFMSCSLTLHNKRAATSKWRRFPIDTFILKKKTFQLFPTMTEHNFKKETEFKGPDRWSFGIIFITDGQHVGGSKTDVTRSNPWHDQPPSMQLEHKLFAGFHHNCLAVKRLCQLADPFRTQSSLDILDQ